MTKSELQSKKRKKPRNHGGPNKNHKPSNIPNEEHETPSASAAKRINLKKEPSSNSNPSTFLDKMRARLSGGHFRMINEKLYTCSGKEALYYFQEDPSLFDLYHAGYKIKCRIGPNSQLM